MKVIKNSILLQVCFFFLVLMCVVGVSYRKTPYLFNVQYQSSQDPEQDGVEKIIVSYIRGVLNCTTENFEYNEEKDRYEYVISGEENTYLNLYLNPFQTFRCALEYRLKYENSIIDHNDGFVVTLYKGSQPVHQELFLLLDRDPTYEYQPKLYISAFLMLFFVGFLLNMVCIVQMPWEKPSHRLAAEGVITVIWSLLWWIGWKTNALIEEAAFQRFVLFYIVFIILLIAVSVFRNGASEAGKFIKETAKQTMFPITFLVVTCCVYIPSSLFLVNIDEFVMPYHRAAGLILLYAVIAFIFFFAIGLGIRNEAGRYIYSLFLFFLTMGFYIQSNFLNPSMPELNGERIDWDRFGTAGMGSRIGWGSLCLAFMILIALLIWKKVRVEKPLRYVSVLLILMQLCSLGVMIGTCRVNPDLYQVCGNEGQFTVRDENVIIFLVDCLQVDAVQTYIEDTEDSKSVLENFTLFTNTIGGGAPTEYAVPLVLTGEEYDPAQRLSDYFDEIWQEGNLLRDLQEENYDVGLYTEAELFNGIPIELAQNVRETSGNRVKNRVSFIQNIIRLANFYMMPLSLKRNFELDTEELKNCLEMTENASEEFYNCDNVSFFKEYQKEHLYKENGKAFRFYHLWGVHKSFRNDEEMKRVANNETDEERTFQGVMLLIGEYMEELKALGVYDNSTIIIFGDHGRHTREDMNKYPAILVKRAGERHPLQYSDAPVCFRNLTATLGSEIKEDYTEYGPSLYDVDQESDVERLQTLNYDTAVRYAGYDGALYADSEVGARFIVDDDGLGNLTYREWNPYEINRIPYTYGDVIDFSASGSYADSLTERLYPAENGKTASNELTICFDLPDEKTEDLELKFTYAGVYNDAQKIRVYANGHKVENVMCTADQIGKEVSVVLPKQYVKEKPVILRMVFPNAVTPKQLDRSNDDTRVLSVTFDKIWLKVANS